VKLISEQQEQAEAEIRTMTENERIEELKAIEEEVLRLKESLEKLFKKRNYLDDLDKEVLRGLADDCLKFIDMIQRRVEFLRRYEWNVIV
jgi:molecular chaperone GrpE (heat shock protein)